MIQQLEQSKAIELPVHFFLLLTKLTLVLAFSEINSYFTGLSTDVPNWFKTIGDHKPYFILYRSMMTFSGLGEGRW